MIDELESTDSKNVPTEAPRKLKLPLLAGAIGLLTFVLSVAVFSMVMGVFSASNVVVTAKHPEGSANLDDGAGTDYERSDFHPSYYDDFYLEDEAPTADSSVKMTKEDSLAQVAWYDKQKQEIENEWRKIEIERRDLEKLKYETVALLDQRRNIEDANTVQMAKLFDSMKAEEIAAILKNLTDQQVGAILMKMKKQNASKTLASMPAERAARITTQMMNLAEGY
jgi:hypothetical protein